MRWSSVERLGATTVARLTVCPLSPLPNLTPDPPREEAVAAVRQCHAAGVTVKMSECRSSW